MILSLTGFMGSGKTTVGRVLADWLGCPFTDLDEEVVRKAGTSIPEIFSAEGEEGFRKREAEALRKIVGEYGGNTAVLSLGGGTLTQPASAALVHEKTLCIYLRATLETLLSRLEGETEGRPLAGEGLAERLSSRTPVYEKTAHVTVDTDGLSPEEIADEIIISVL